MEIKNINEIVNFATTESGKNARRLLLNLYRIAVESVDPYNIIRDNMTINNLENFFTIQNDKFSIKNKKLWIIGAGKAIGRMAEALETLLSNYEVEGIICIPKGLKNELKLNRIQYLESTHPLPSKINITNTKKVLDLITRIDEEDLVFVLISGGGSAIWAAPIPPITIEDLIALNETLINSGMSIHEINAIRKHVSLIKGGRMAKVVKSNVIVLVLSDVIGDKLDSIASGPFYPDSSSFLYVQDLLKKYGLWRNLIPSTVKQVIKEGMIGILPETPKKEDRVFKKVRHYILGSNMIARQAVASYAREINIKSELYPDLMDGDARKAGIFLFKKSVDLIQEENDLKIFIGGGEPTIKVIGTGTGGRNQEVAAAFLDELIKLGYHLDVAFLSAGTDGIDGNSNYAGAIVDDFTKHRIHKRMLKLNDYQVNNDLTAFFEKVQGSLILTGPTGTNVMDIYFVLIHKSKL